LNEFVVHIEHKQTEIIAANDDESQAIGNHLHSRIYPLQLTAERDLAML
jgi:hypothetical protein